MTFTAEEVEYDQNRGVVTARGRVEAWQGERFLRADEFTYDRNTGVVTAQRQRPADRDEQARCSSPTRPS